MKQFFLLLIALIVFSCKKEVKNEQIPPFIEAKPKSFNLKYAKGFTVENGGNFKTLTITKPWPNATKNYTYALIPKEKLATITLNKDDYDGIIVTPIEKLVVTSTTHLPALDLLGVSDKLVGFPGTDYISSKPIRELIKTKHVVELGKNESINTEVLLELNPNVVIGFGVDGTNKTFETIKKANIPIIYNADWVEASPLAKAEWIKFFGLLFNKEDKATSVFNNIVADYLDAKELVENITDKPTVLSGAMHKDVWYLPNAQSSEAQILKDAGVDFLWKDTKGKGSLALSFETVFSKAKDADLWISPSYYTSLKDLKSANSHYTEFKPFKNNNIFTFSNTTGETGGVLYYELGLARPDLVLKDIIKIAHPEKLPDYELFFFKKLQ